VTDIGIFILLVIAGGTLIGALAAQTNRWRRERRSIDDYGTALNRLRALGRLSGVDEGSGTRIVLPAASVADEVERDDLPEGRLPLGISSHDSGMPRHAVRSNAEANSRIVDHRSVIDHWANPRTIHSSDERNAYVEIPPDMFAGEVALSPSARGVADAVEGLRRLGTEPMYGASRLVEEAARVVGVFEGNDAREPGVEANARLTANTGLLLVVLFFCEGLTIPVIGRFLNWHIAIGLALIPPVLLKIGSTLWRFGHYYWGDRRYVRAGPPHPMLRVLGPLVMISTVVIIASGVALWLVGPQDRLLFRVHQLTFVLWFIVVAVHLLSHVWRATRLAAADSRDAHRRGSGLPGSRTRRLVVVMSLVAGTIVGLAGTTVTTGWSHRTAHVSAHLAVLRPHGQRMVHVTTTTGGT
jgi:hypothetical protein